MSELVKEMNKFVYYKVVPFTRKEAETAFASGNQEKISDALVGLAYYEADWEYVRDICIKFLSDNNNKNHSMAAISLGHIARIHKNLEIRKVIPFLESFLSDPEIGGIVEDTIEDIMRFTDVKKHITKTGNKASPEKE